MSLNRIDLTGIEMLWQTFAMVLLPKLNAINDRCWDNGSMPGRIYGKEGWKVNRETPPALRTPEGELESSGPDTAKLIHG